jgi:hypothetical protein
MSFADVLEAADHLPTDEQETLIGILQRRLIDRRREEIAQDIREANEEFAAGRCRAATPDELLDEILS